MEKVTWVREGRADRLVVKRESHSDDPPEQSASEMASLTAIVHIDGSDFWMTSDGAYPDLPPVKADYDQVVANLQELRGQVATPSFCNGGVAAMP